MPVAVIGGRPELSRFRLARVLRIFGVAFVVFAALAVHATGSFEYVLRVQSSKGARLKDLIH